MEIDTGSFTALAAEVERLREQLLDLGQAVTDMGAEMKVLREDACTIRTLEEVAVRRAGMLHDDPPFSASRPMTELDKLKMGIPLSRADRKEQLTMLPGGAR